MSIIERGRNRLIETTIPAKDPRRVIFVGKDGIGYDLKPTHKPPIIVGIAKSDPRRILVITENSRNIPVDINPEALGLTAACLFTLTTLFNS